MTKPGSQSGPGDAIAVKRAASLANQSGTLRILAVIGGERPEALLAAGANQLVFPAGVAIGAKGLPLARLLVQRTGDTQCARCSCSNRD